MSLLSIFKKKEDPFDLPEPSSTPTPGIEEKTLHPDMPEQPTNLDRPMAFQQTPKHDVSHDNKDLDIINQKLDTILAQLKNIDYRVAEIEKIAKNP